VIRWRAIGQHREGAREESEEVIIHVYTRSMILM